MLYFDDLFIGMEFKPLTSKFTKEDIRNYAEAVEDFNPLFLDEQHAKKSKFNGLINHPATAAILSVNAHKTGETLPSGIIHAKQRYKFYSPTRPEENLITRAKVIDKYMKRGKKYVVIQSITVNEVDQKKVESTAVLIWPK
ncbi:MaoC family dehydratase [Desulfoscipio geothermicus]|uniref:Acyl dehydratase n=1 Tax=Desulfoscipio geothermicus DSM 3669 TaxID=1121426 RepID=A0A1I6DGU2_9FIRM|nr:MaoC family dehydratase [Desulfoscipio geothermicus]SFR04601.1 Acyl dehydratase [Desulfoscipio geothermicus DSM 3669]